MAGMCRRNLLLVIPLLPLVYGQKYLKTFESNRISPELRRKPSIYYDMKNSLSSYHPKCVTVFVGHKFLTYRQPDSSNKLYQRKSEDAPSWEFGITEQYNIPNSHVLSSIPSKFYKKLTYEYHPEIIYALKPGRHHISKEAQIPSYVKSLLTPKQLESYRRFPEIITTPLSSYRNLYVTKEKVFTKTHKNIHSSLTHSPRHDHPLHPFPKSRHPSDTLYSLEQENLNFQRHHVSVYNPSESVHWYSPNPDYRPGPIHYNCDCNKYKQNNA